MKGLTRRILKGMLIPAAAALFLITFIFRAGDPLVDLASEDHSVRASAATALGRDKVLKSMGLLVVALKDQYASVREKAAYALGELHNPIAVPYLMRTLKDHDKNVRIRAAEALGKMGAQNAIDTLKENLTDWHSNKIVFQALTRLGWKPQSDRERIHCLVAMRKETSLKNKWSLAKGVLLKDMESRNYSDIENALQAFIAIDEKEIFPTLVQKLGVEGNMQMAKAYLNSGHPKLDSAAKKWEAKNGIKISIDVNDSPFAGKLMEKNLLTLKL